VRPLLALLATALLALAGCGGDDDAREPAASDAPAVTAPGTDIPYQSGGADGSGADGTEEPDPRGGPGATADTDGRGEEAEPNNPRDNVATPDGEPQDPPGTGSGGGTGGDSAEPGGDKPS
jgi:hypothetical protein